MSFYWCLCRLYGSLAKCVTHGRLLFLLQIIRLSHLGKK